MLPCHPSPSSAATPPPNLTNIDEGQHDLEKGLPCSTNNSTGDAEVVAPTEFGDDGGQHVTNRELDTVLSPYFQCVDGGPTRYVSTVRSTVNAGETEASRSAAKYAKVLLSLFGVCQSACSAAFPVIKQAAPDACVVVAYSLLVVLALVLLAGLLATSFDKSPSSVVWGKYALQLALGLIIGFLTWSLCSLVATRKFNVAVGVAGSLVYIAVVTLFRSRKW